MLQDEQFLPQNDIIARQKMSAYKIQLIASNWMKGTVIKSLCGREFFDTPEDAEMEAKKIIEALKMKELKYEIVEEVKNDTNN